MVDSTQLQTQYVEQALRDILYIFYQMSYTYSGFGWDIDTGAFDPFQLIELPDDFAENYQLLKQGAVVKMLSELYTACYNVGFEDEIWQTQYYARFFQFALDGRLWEFPEAQDFIIKISRENPKIELENTWVKEGFDRLYNLYVTENIRNIFHL